MPPSFPRPPLAVSPRRLRPRKNLRSAPSLQTPPASIKTKPKTPVRSSLQFAPEFSLISTELMKMARSASQEFTDLGAGLSAVTSSPMFERGRFYDVYSARRNERLKRKQLDLEFGVEEAVVQDPGIAVELAKRRNTKKAESVRKSLPANFSVSRASSLRSSVRNSKDVKKVGGGVSFGICDKAGGGAGGGAAATVGRRIGTRSVFRRV